MRTYFLNIRVRELLYECSEAIIGPRPVATDLTILVLAKVNERIFL
jgi:hypothetical protein